MLSLDVLNFLVNETFLFIKKLPLLNFVMSIVEHSEHCECRFRVKYNYKIQRKTDILFWICSDYLWV